ncbi:hypothetical protein KFL_001130040 [Klebsormidium nitens]|uniref:MYND-type domain-containing protein n=1 Tax=Klebsormidium nitens TaxID=105231 RepID=A0A0U9HJI3_KLENI|nr:hypothetical protein KFL_001130040 [Klebsormidium nitens]|eukprot:GAQ82485.1 hypothetical protein KFL_001130040 [Klebsormidium nitens]
MSKMARKAMKPLPTSAPSENVPLLSTLTCEEMSTLRKSGLEPNIKLDFLKPEASPWLQEILQELRSDDESRRMFAIWRFKESYAYLLWKQSSRTDGVNVSNFILSNGIGREIRLGLDDAISSGRWYWLPKDFIAATLAGKKAEIFSKVSIYCCALDTLAVDFRSFKYILKEIPDVFQVLFSFEEQDQGFYTMPVSIFYRCYAQPKAQKKRPFSTEWRPSVCTFLLWLLARKQNPESVPRATPADGLEASFQPLGAFGRPDRWALFRTRSSRRQLEEQIKSVRKCSRAGCEKIEAAEGTFKLCGGCRLACYCSRECQKMAWKQGHRDQCCGKQENAPGRQKSK